MALSRLGGLREGNARVEKFSPERRSEIARMDATRPKEALKRKQEME